MVKADSDKYKNMLKEVRKLCEKLNDIIDDDIVMTDNTSNDSKKQETKNMILMEHIEIWQGWHQL